jgi:signal transduction histidine kinase
MKARWTVRQSVLPVVMILALAVSSIVAVRGAYRMRAVEERALRDYAELAAWNYSARAYSMLTNFAPAVIVAAGKRGVRGPVHDLAAIVGALDSLRDCCETPLPAAGVATGAWGDTASIRLHSSSVLSSSATAARIAALGAVAMQAPMATASARFATGGDKATPFMYVVYPQFDRDRKPAGFIAVDLDLRVAADSMFGAMFRSGSLLLPQSMAAVPDNPALGELALVDGGGRELFRNRTPDPTDYTATVGFGRDTTVRLTFRLSAAAARGLLRGTMPGQGAKAQVVLALLAFLLALLIAVTLRRAQNLARARADFAAAVTHELRTPLTHILVNAETLQLQRERSSGERGAFVDAIVDESRRLVHLIDNVLHFSRAEQRTLHVRRAPERIDTLVSRTFGARPGVVVDAAEPVMASVDAQALHLAMANVIDNAMQHGSAPVRVFVAATSGGAEIVIDDTGPGIPLRDRRRVFEPYVRLAPAKDTHPTGSGIGLSVVAEVMRAMGGSVVLEDATPSGLRVRLILQS